MAKKKVRDAPVGVIRVLPKKKGGKSISKNISKNILKLIKPSAKKLIPAYSAYELGDFIYNTASPAFSKDKANELEEGLTPEAYRKTLLSMVSTKKGRDESLTAIKELLKSEIKNTVKPPEWSRPYAKATKKRIADRKKPSLFNPTRKELLERSKRVVRKKRGGKVGRPKGVGCATRGYGKAMKRGK